MQSQCVCVYGETCSGKSTLGKAISFSLDCRYISFGDLKREEIKRSTEVGLEIQNLLNQKCLLPAELGYTVIKDSIQCGLNIISGYPISIDEFSLLSKHLKIVGFIVLNVSEQALISRFKRRRECPKCHLPGIIGDSCPVHSEPMIEREDFSTVDLLKRRELYSHRIEPFLQSHGVHKLPKLVIDTTSQSTNEVLTRAENWIRKVLT